jgi:V/A-type H+-transporting ATPase subunit I
MALRPTPTSWFEVVVPEADAGDAIAGLADLATVQFEWTGRQGGSRGLAGLDGPIARYRELAAQYSRHWPEPLFTGRCCTLPVDVSAQAALHQIENWLGEAEEPLRRIASLRERRRVLEHWGELLPALAVRAPRLDLGALAAAGPMLAGFCMRLPQAATAAIDAVESRLAAQQAALTLALVAGGHCTWLGLVAAAEQAALCDWLRAQGGECLSLPDWRGDPAVCAAELRARLADTARELEALEAALRESARQHGVHHAAGVLERIDWFRRTAQNIQCDGRYCWITGWTSESDAAGLERALRVAGVGGTAVLAEPPADMAAPSVLRHGFWQRPFEVFARAVGVPGPTEADPTTWVALLVPLMFGYMCGDLGHGAVIAGVGLLLRRRTTLWPLLVVCGVAAMGFGLAYGDVFGFEHVIDPLWMRPLDQPLTILAVPVGFGALVLTLGLVLHTVQSCWRGKGRSEGVADAAQLLVYWSLMLALLWPVVLWGAAMGVLLCAGNRLWTQRDPLALAAGLGHLLESTFSLLLNTLSFARVGAFALAHAALELAVMTIADGMSGAVAVALAVIIGNLVVIVLEGIVVSIQTSRLVLFEFFVRFFEGTGRHFEPAPAPPAATAGSMRR